MYVLELGFSGCELKCSMPWHICAINGQFGHSKGRRVTLYFDRDGGAFLVLCGKSAERMGGKRGMKI